jgi:hypothetical protein
MRITAAFTGFLVCNAAHAGMSQFSFLYRESADESAQGSTTEP